MSQNWELNINFKVSGKGKELYGDGFAIWYAKERLNVGAVFGSKDHFSGLAIIFDTYSNHNGPHNVSIEFHCLSNILISTTIIQFSMKFIHLLNAYF